MNSIAPRRPSDIEPRVADAARLRAHHLALAHQPEAESVDENIRVVRRGEHHLSGDSRHSHAIAVSAYPADHTAEQVARSRMVKRSEFELFHPRDRPRAHRENVAQDS